MGPLPLGAFQPCRPFGGDDRGLDPAAGYLDRLYVHRDFQRQGIARALCDALEGAAEGPVETHASITARGFFARRGYRVLRAQQVERRGILLTNFVMRLWR